MHLESFAETEKICTLKDNETESNMHTTNEPQHEISNNVVLREKSNLYIVIF